MAVLRPRIGTAKAVYTTRHIITGERINHAKIRWQRPGRDLSFRFVFHFAGDLRRQSFQPASRCDPDVARGASHYARLSRQRDARIWREGNSRRSVEPGRFYGASAGRFDCNNAHSPRPSGSRHGRQVEEARDHYRRAARRHRYPELRAGLRHRRGDQRFRTEDGDGHRIRGRPDVQPGVWIGPGKTVSPQGNRKRLRFELWRHSRLFFGRYGMHAGNERPEKYFGRVPGDESSPNRASARSRGVRESVQAENCVSLSLSRLKAGRVLRCSEEYARSGSSDSEVGRRAVKKFAPTFPGSQPESPAIKPLLR